MQPRTGSDISLQQLFCRLVGTVVCFCRDIQKACQVPRFRPRCRHSISHKITRSCKVKVCCLRKFQDARQRLNRRIHIPSGKRHILKGIRRLRRCLCGFSTPKKRGFPRFFVLRIICVGSCGPFVHVLLKFRPNVIRFLKCNSRCHSRCRSHFCDSRRNARCLLPDTGFRLVEIALEFLHLPFGILHRCFERRIHMSQNFNQKIILRIFPRHYFPSVISRTVSAHSSKAVIFIR